MDLRNLCLFLILAGLSLSNGWARTFEPDVAPLIELACIHCHDADTETRLNFDDLGHDLADPKTLRQWELVYDRLHDGEMPPPGEDRPDADQLENSLTVLKRELLAASRFRQESIGRVPLRRLTRTEYENTIRDLLLIHQDLGSLLPAETAAAGFDTVGTAQGISDVHIQGYLRAADEALDLAINLGPRPPSEPYVLDYHSSSYVHPYVILEEPYRLGGNIGRKLSDEVAYFLDRDYPFKSDRMGLELPYPGLYRISIPVRAFQTVKPVTFTLNLESDARGLKQLLGAYELAPGRPRLIQVTTYMTPGDGFFPSTLNEKFPAGGFWRSGGGQNYKGAGIAMGAATVEGPLEETWPPANTWQLLTGVEIVQRRSSVESAHGLGDEEGAFEVKLSGEPIDHVTQIVARLAPLAMRRPPLPGEVDGFVDRARAPIDDGREFLEAVRLPLRALLSSPQFLFFGGAPGELDDFALASRLSYFLWKSLPDEELFQLAAKGELSNSQTLADQVERMLRDEKSARFVRDFVGQWLGLRDIDTTTPDKILHPEYNDGLRHAFLRETELFFAELIKEDLGVRNLIDSDFAFLNSRLAKHYGIDGVSGEHFRRVMLPNGSPRGGVLTHASVLKVTANGTTTSPVTRGNFVLTNILGEPPDPPPPGAGSIEPDTRGTTTIRETLDAHRHVAECARCHRLIDPPGFAMECFDPIGMFRLRYRAIPAGVEPNFSNAHTETYYSVGLEVDTSGVIADGQSFSGIRDFKKLLLDREDQIAKHVISQLVVYATGAEIQFADREIIDRLASRMREQGYPLRTIIQEIVQSELFRRM